MNIQKRPYHTQKRPNYIKRDLFIHKRTLCRQKRDPYTPKRPVKESCKRNV